MTKITCISFLLFLIGAQGTELSELNQGLVLHPQRHLLGKVLNPVPDPKHIDIPEEFDWGSVQDGNGRTRNFLTQARNQHIPRFCGSCWAHATTSALSDRIKIARQGAFPDINISPQVLVSCAQDGGNNGCHGGDPKSANAWMAEHNITDETCSIYQAMGWDNGLDCTDLSLCENCMPGKPCYQQKKYFRFRVEEYDHINGNTIEEREANMKAEILKRGPIACTIAVPKALVSFQGGSVFYDQTGTTKLEHEISVVGWGVDESSGWNYWRIRNSWGTYWADQGFFKLRRGINNLGIEMSGCDWATPDMELIRQQFEGLNKYDPIEDNDAAATVEDSNYHGHFSKNEGVFAIFLDIIQDIKDKFQQKEEDEEFTCNCYIKPSSKNLASYVIKSSQPSEEIDIDDLPKDGIDWRNVDGINYLSWTVNQHIPTYCGSCWAQGSVSALADRFIIADPQKYANLALNPQVVVNCREGGSCNGGDANGVYQAAVKVGIPDNTCQQYVAKNLPEVLDCSKPNIEVCKNCKFPIPNSPDEPSNCFAVQNFTRYFAEEWGPVRGAAAMKKEIWKRGPIACGIAVTRKFLKYTDGIYSQTGEHGINHIISVVGWGRDAKTGTEYWIGRNSWGTYWGEAGFFRIKMYEDNLSIEEDCVWAVPKL